MAANRGKHLGMLHNIERLSGPDDYHDWAVLMKAYLEHEDLFDTIVAPAGGILSTDATKKRLAKTKLILSVDRVVLSQIENLDCPKAIWETLQTTYASKSLYRKTSLIIEFTKIRLEDCSSTEQYIDRITTLHQKLKDIGKDLGDDFAACMMLGGLPPEYEPMRMALESLPESEINTQNIKAKILLKVKWDNAGTKTDEVGLYSSNNNKRVYSQGPKPNTRNSNGRFSNVRCYRCNKRGHISKQCTLPDTRSRNRHQANQVSHDDDDDYSNEEEDQVAAFAFVGLSAKYGASPDDWIIDSGASRHMCNDRSCFVSMRKSSLVHITVANREKIYVKGEGDIIIQLRDGTKIKLLNVLFVPDIAANLISVSEVNDRGYSTNFSSSGCEIRDPNRNPVLYAEMKNGVYKVHCAPKSRIEKVEREKHREVIVTNNT